MVGGVFPVMITDDITHHVLCHAITIVNLSKFVCVVDNKTPCMMTPHVDLVVVDTVTGERNVTFSCVLSTQSLLSPRNA